MADDGEKKLIIDEDWKREAQREKEILAEQEKQQKQSQAGPPLPPADFQGLMSVFVTQAYLALGLLKVDKDADPVLDFPMAKFNIDMLEVLQEKTRGNLTEEESKLLEETLASLRMAFVQLADSA